ncbi:MAG TPA: universal stress protein [Coriobacteriia bacterium]|nr:universal stress protein [Coriobacteriia bacterium]
MAIRKMLVPLALTPRDEKLLAYACGLVEQGVHQLLVAHVVDSSGLEAPVVFAEVERARERLLAMVAPYGGSGQDIEVRVTTGEVYREIMALASQVNTDVILCGTEGKSFVDYLFSGSIAEDLALAGDVRTMTVRWDQLEVCADVADLAHGFARRLVVPTDFSSSSLRAVLSAFERRERAIGTIHLLHVLVDGESRLDAEIHMRAQTALAEEHGVDYVAAIREGDPAEAVLAYLAEVDATGVITGRRGKGRFGRELLGSVSMRLLQEAACPVVIQP